MAILKFPGVFFIEVVPTLFGDSEWKTDKPFHTFDEKKGLYKFSFGGVDHVSDSAEELVEIATREIEKCIKEKIAENRDNCPYVTLPLTCDVEQGPGIDFCDAFAVLERPWRVEVYTDTFRRGISKLRKLKESK